VIRPLTDALSLPSSWEQCVARSVGSVVREVVIRDRCIRWCLAAGARLR
jgi:hypothetical protein